MKNINGKSKGEQLFILLIALSAILFSLFATGCGGRSCETPKCKSDHADTYKVSGCSIPGVGGCLTSGWGCNCAFWPQNCKFAKGIEKDENGESILKASSCDIQYYGNNCLGCGGDKKSCYTVRMDDEEANVSGIFIGVSDKNEKFIGCIDGCAKCTASGKLGYEYITALEQRVEID